MKYEATYTSVKSSSGNPAETVELLDCLIRAADFIKIVVVVILGGYLTLHAGSIVGSISKVVKVKDLLISSSL